MNRPITLTPGKLYKRRKVKSTPLYLDLAQKVNDVWTYKETPDGKIDNVFWHSDEAVLIIVIPPNGVGIGIYQDKFACLYESEAVEI